FLRKSNEYAINTLYHKCTVFVSFNYTLPAVNPPAPAPQHKLASPHSQASTKTLPATGEATSMLSLLGLTLIGFVGAWTKKKEH
ncbi:LPXTG cell wall anchor domain-containing protein, partial [Streptococcus suis]